MSVTNLTAQQAREKLSERQKALGEIFEQAKTTGGDGQGVYDFNRVTCLGADVKGSIAVAQKVEALTVEAEELAKHAETLEAAENAAKAFEARSREVRRPQHPVDGKGAREGAIKSLGELIAGEKSYADWAKSGAAGGITLNFNDALPSDLMAKAAAFPTLGAKALLQTGAGYAPEVLRQPGFVEAATRPIQLLDIIPMFPTGQAAIKYMEETTRTHAAAEASEGGDYAESTFAFTERSTPVEKITDSVPVTDEQLEDVAMMEGYINSRLMFGVRQRLDRQVIAGDGSAPNLKGLKNVSGIQTQAKGSDPVMDAFFKAMTKIMLTGRAMATHHVMHPTDWQNIRLTRTADGIYIFGSPTDAGPARLWGLPVVMQDAVSAGWGMTGSFDPSWISLFERRGVDVQIGYVGTQFAQGKRTVRADMRAALAVFRPAAFCEVTDL